jgi:hypothetical protein
MVGYRKFDLNQERYPNGPGFNQAVNRPLYVFHRPVALPHLSAGALAALDALQQILSDLERKRLPPESRLIFAIQPYGTNTDGRF